MKNMTKFFLVSLFAFFFINANGQTFLVKGGSSFSSFINITDKGRHKQPHGFKKGLFLGISHEEALFDNFFVEAGPMLQMKGSHYSYPYTNAMTTLYLDMPILAKLYYELADDVFLYNAAGAYFGIGLNGYYRNSDEKINIEWSESRFGLKRLDVGFSLGIGFVFKEVQIGVGYDRGLLDINSDIQESEYKTKNNVFRFSVGYRFGKQAENEE